MPTNAQPTATDAHGADRLANAAIRAAQLKTLIDLVGGVYGLVLSIMMADMVTGGKVTYRLTWRIEAYRDQLRREREARRPNCSEPEVIIAAERIVNDVLRSGRLKKGAR